MGQFGYPASGFGTVADMHTLTVTGKSQEPGAYTWKAVGKMARADTDGTEDIGDNQFAVLSWRLADFTVNSKLQTLIYILSGTRIPNSPIP
jgi:hypothetical protein